MFKFKCEKCDGDCELIIDALDLEDQLPTRCPLANIDAEFQNMDAEWQEVRIAIRRKR